MSDLLILCPAADDRDYGASWPPLFERLATPLRARGLSVAAAPWTEPFDTGSARVILPLLTWGYPARTDAWFALLERLQDSGARVINPAAVLAWNTTKTYLTQLAARGAPVVPTLTPDRLTEAALVEAFETFGVDRLVVKPQISGGSQDTVRLSRGEALVGGPPGPALIQPFLPAVRAEGELSLFYFDGVFSHAVSKVAAAGDFRVQPQFGGLLKAVTPEPEALRAAQQVLEAAATPLTYARIDLIRGLDQTLQLMELEVIEPDLFVQYAPDGGAAFAAAVIAGL